MADKFEQTPEDSPLCLCRFTDAYGSVVEVQKEEGHSRIYVTVEQPDDEEWCLLLTEETVALLWKVLRSWSSTQ
jgi:hypothetical protein